MLILWWPVVGYICFVLLAQFVRGEESTGAWNTLTDSQLALDQFARYYTWRGLERLQDWDNATLLAASFTSKSPCRALALHDNCFSHNPNRATGLLHRSFTSSKQSYLNSSLKALINLQNTLVVFAGDRTMASVYASLVCHFSQFSTATYNFDWLYDHDKHLHDSDGQDKCPGDPSCYLVGGETVFAAQKVTFRFIQVTTYQGKGSEAFQRFIHDHTQPSIVIVNFGAHYTDEEAFSEDLLAFRRDGVKASKRLAAAGASGLQWFWLESAPRHYVNVVGANQTTVLDASHTAKSHFNLLCEPIENKALYHKLDWRNRLVETLVPDFQRSSRLIPIAHALYDQWDAHVDNGDSFRAEAHMDCAHYCVGSGVFRFIVDQVLSSVQTCLGGGCANTAFFDKADSPPVVKSAATEAVVREKTVTVATIPLRCHFNAAVGHRQQVGQRHQQPMRAQRRKDANCV